MKTTDIMLLAGVIAGALFLQKRTLSAPPPQVEPEGVDYIDVTPAAGGGGGGDSFDEFSLPVGFMPEAWDYGKSWMDRSAEEWAYKMAYGMFPLPEELRMSP